MSNFLSDMSDEQYEDFRKNACMADVTNTFYKVEQVATAKKVQYSFEEFKAALINKHPPGLYVMAWSSIKLYVTFFGPLYPNSDVIFVCSALADLTPKTMTWEQFYEWCKGNPGLTEFTF